MSLAACLPDRPLRFAETMRRRAADGVDFVTPLFATSEQLTGREDELVVASLLLADDRATYAAFDRDESKWIDVAIVPDITALQAVFPSLDVLETWLFERYSIDELVAINVDV